MVMIQCRRRLCDRWPADWRGYAKPAILICPPTAQYTIAPSCVSGGATAFTQNPPC